LFFKNSEDSVYQSVAMDSVPGTANWAGYIPAEAVTAPGVDYYITASDSISTTSSPEVNPASSPFQIAILPNIAPFLEHSPIKASETGVDLPIVTYATDETNQLDTVILFYKKRGQLIYEKAGMVNTADSTYQANIPGGFITTDGTDYFMLAVDDFGVSSSVGSFDDPIEIKLLQTITLDSIGNQPLDSGSVLVNAQASSGLPVTIEVTAGNVTQNDNEITFEGAGKVTLIATQPGDEKYNAADTVSLSFCVNPPVPEITINGTDEISAELSLTSGSAENNQWYKDGEKLEGETGQDLAISEAGSYTVRVETEGGCFSESEPEVITNTETYEEVITKAYPIPASERLTIEVPPQKGKIKAAIYNLNGEMVEKSTINANRDMPAIEVEISGLVDGLYILILEGDDFLLRKKIQKLSR